VFIAVVHGASQDVLNWSLYYIRSFVGQYGEASRARGRQKSF
jgi:hypothetical protein